MAFKMNGFSGFRDKIRIKKAKRLIRKHVGHVTVDSPIYDESKFAKADKKLIKAVKLLRKAGKTEEEIETATGAGGYQAAIEYATKKKKKK